MVGNKKEIEKNGTAGKNEQEIQTVKIRELHSDDTVRIFGIAKVMRTFTDKTDGSPTKGQEVNKEQLVLKCSINNSINRLLLVDYNTTMYKQLVKYIEDNHLELPVKLLDETFTVKTGGSGVRQYYYFDELATGIDYGKLFD